MPRKTRRRISGTRRSRRIRRRGTRIRGGNRRYHNGGENPFLTSIQAGLSKLQNKAQQENLAAKDKFFDTPNNTSPTSTALNP